MGDSRGGAILRFLLRMVAMVAMTAWVGGFMFYGGAVVPILEDALGRFDSGQITRRVTVMLNGVGWSTVAAWTLLAWMERGDGGRIPRVARLACLLASIATLACLVALHGAMGRHLDEFGTRGFRPLHRAYLLVSTIQWLANLGILAATIHIWTTHRRFLDA